MLFTHKQNQNSQNIRYTPEGRSFELSKEQLKSLARTPSPEQAAATRSSAEAAGKVAVIGAEQAGETTPQIDPSHELPAQASETDPNQAA